MAPWKTPWGVLNEDKEPLSAGCYYQRDLTCLLESFGYRPIRSLVGIKAHGNLVSWL